MFKKTDQPDGHVVDVKLTIHQITALEKLVGSDLGNAEQFGESMIPQKQLQKLCDVFFPILHAKESEEEEKAHIRAWRNNVAKKELEKLCPGA